MALSSYQGPKEFENIFIINESLQHLLLVACDIRPIPEEGQLKSKRFEVLALPPQFMASKY